MADHDDVAKQVDAIYKGLLDKFHPAARQLVTAGKAYLKALNGASASGRAYYEAVQKLAGSAGACDSGSSLHQLCTVYKDLQAAELTALRAFHVDLLLPLETNIDKDAKQLQGAHKGFTSVHKQLRDTHTKASAAVKRNRKKGRTRANGVDKQIKHYQALEESKARLETHLTQSLQAACQEERRRVGFVLERHCSLSRHHLALHTKGETLLQNCLPAWSSVAAARDVPVDTHGSLHLKPLEEMEEEDEAIYSTPSVELCELEQRVRRARSVDMSLVEEMDEDRNLSRATSDLNLATPRSGRDGSSECSTQQHSSSSAPTPRVAMARALYSYTGSADTQLSFVEGDTLLLIGDRADGWQYGENNTTGRRGWFPVAYTEDIPEDGADSAIGPVMSRVGAGGTVSSWSSGDDTSDTGSSDTITSLGTVRAAHPPTVSRAPSSRVASSAHATRSSGSAATHNPVTSSIFKILQNSKNHRIYSKDRLNADDFNTNDFSVDKLSTDNKLSSRRHHLRTSDQDSASDTSISLSCSLPGLASSSSSSTQRGRVSFHSSNDSGFSNDGSRPPQPTVDYSDAESLKHRYLDSSFASSDTEPLTYFPTGRVHGRSCSLGRCENHLFFKRENSRCKDEMCDCNNQSPKQTPILSPSAKKILAQRNNRANQKKGKNSLRRSKSLLCLGMNSCRGVPDDLMSNDYEEMFAKDWYHRSLVDVNKDIPEPPSHDPPTPPCAECLASSCNTSCTYCTSDLTSGSNSKENLLSDQFHDQTSRPLPPNRPAMKPCKAKKRPPMPLPIEALHSDIRNFDSNASLSHNRKSEDKKVKRSDTGDLKRESNIVSKSISRLSRSLTWASPKSNQLNNKQTYMYESNKTARKNYINSMIHNRQNSSLETTTRTDNCPKTPPLPPRSHKVARTLESPVRGEPVNMMTYADFIARRLRYPEGASVLDQQSNSGRHMCGKWYDLWDESTSCTEI